jgi:t-SNARE complex subunit (syntaxin)
MKTRHRKKLIFKLLTGESNLVQIVPEDIDSLGVTVMNTDNDLKTGDSILDRAVKYIREQVKSIREKYARLPR